MQIHETLSQGKLLEPAKPVVKILSGFDQLRIDSKSNEQILTKTY